MHDVIACNLGMESGNASNQDGPGWARLWWTLPGKQASGTESGECGEACKSTTRRGVNRSDGHIWVLYKHVGGQCFFFIITCICVSCIPWWIRNHILLTPADGYGSVLSSNGRQKLQQNQIMNPGVINTFCSPPCSFNTPHTPN